MSTVDSKTAAKALEHFKKELAEAWIKGWMDGYDIGYRKGFEFAQKKVESPLYERNGYLCKKNAEGKK